MKLHHLLLSCMLGLFISSGAEESPCTKPDGSWISLKGTIVSTTPSAFDLDYGQGIVMVEMDDWDWYKEGNALIAGDEVTVYGKVDDDLYEMTSIEASSVYVDDLNTYFYASLADEESAPYYLTTIYADFDVAVTGEVTKTSGREFTIDTGNRTLTVDTYEMPYNPMDDAGFQKVEKGDLVSVSGRNRQGFFWPS